MQAYLLAQLNRDLVWVQAAAHGTAWFGYDPKDMNAPGAVRQILRMHVVNDFDYAIELWHRGRQAEFTCHDVYYTEVLRIINSIMSEVKS